MSSTIYKIGGDGVLIAFLFSCFAARLSRRLSVRLGALDLPDGVRKLQKSPIPKLGGVGIYLSFAAVFLLSGSAVGRVNLVQLIGGGIIVLVGAFDDIYSYKPWHKLTLEYAASLGSAVFMLAPDSFSDFAVALGHSLFILLIINAFNIMDGLDGLSATLSLPPLLFLFTESSAAGLVFFSVLGFLPHNIPAKIYLGESGAAFLGYFIAVTFLYESSAVWGFFTLAVPVFEVLVTVIRRAAVGKSLFYADRGHIHHRLFSLGFDAPSVACVLTLACIFVIFAAYIITK